MAIETAKPKVTLLSWTSSPLVTMSYGWRIMHNQVPDNLYDYVDEVNMQDVINDFREMVKNGIGTPQEYVNTVWVIKNVSRAFQQQLTRYRVGTSFSIQTLRMVDLGSFANNGNYTMPSGLADGEQIDYHDAMVQIQNNYRDMVDRSMEIQDARGILPLNVHSNISMAVNLRSLSNIVSQRMCAHAQDEWKEVVQQMRREISSKMSMVIAQEIFKPPCEARGKCLIPEKCCGHIGDNQ